ncbi:mercuric reductase [Myxosarcina sp. GI1(2024)]
MSHSRVEKVIVPPMDEYNRRLVDYVHPIDWISPKPAACYDLVVIGAGTAGLVVAKGAAGIGIGLKIALIERHLMGGDCLNVGCIPSKCIIRSSRVVAEMQEAEKLGIAAPETITVDFASVMRRMRRVRSQISKVDSAAGAKKSGVDVFLGQARFSSADSVEVDGKILRFKKAVIATGARAIAPEIEGLAEAGYLTNETVFNLTEKPNRLAVIGGGPIGCELAQAFHRLGSRVTLLHRGGHLLSNEDSEAAAIVRYQFETDGVNLVLNSEIQFVRQTSRGKEITYTKSQGKHTVTVDEILVGAGRAPNVEGLNLEAVNVKYDRHGVKVNDFLQTSNPRIYAAGDICLKEKFTHTADATARIVIKNTLFAPFGLGKDKLSKLIIPWVTYTDPEIAHVGLYAEEAQAQGIKTNTIKIDFNHLDRALADGEEGGFLKIHHPQDSDKILGATIVARHAGEMISEVTTAITNGIGLSKLASVIHPYPTQAEAIKKAADTYRRTLLTPKTKFFLGLLTKFS